MDMSYAQALNEAKQVIVQQSNRIKADAEKTRQLQQTVIDQCSVISDHETKLKDRSSEVAALAAKLEIMEAKLSEMTVGRQQAEAVCDRQGQRLTTLQEQVAEMDKKLAEQAETISTLTAERDGLRQQLPSREDEEALAAMAELLTTKKAPGSSNSMRIAKESFAKAA